MANDAYKLKGLDGWQLVSDGETFAGRSGGFQVLVDGTFDAICQPVGTTGNNSFAAAALVSGVFIGGTITALTAGGGGAALVYPLDADFTIA